MKIEPVLTVRFYREPSGNEPVREWLFDLTQEERKVVGSDIGVVQFRWPLGLPLVRPLGKGLYEVRSGLANRIARVIFTVRDGEMILLHGFIKKTQATSLSDMELARKRLARI